MHCSHRNGFTLVELSIVLVVIALLVGGVVFGAEMIESGRRRAVISELKQFELVTNAFRLKFGQIPGDFKSAQAFFGSSNICNGDGDGRFPESLSPACLKVDAAACPTASSYSQSEGTSFWKHLHAAGLYSQTVCGNSAGNTLAYDYIKSKYSGLGYSIFSATYHNINTGWLGLAGNSNTALFSAETSASLDLKVDDGKCNRGNFVVITCTCSTAGTGVYPVTSSTKCLARYNIAKWL
jgi:prepilin-type N-terminal cleavage/methylation domain-containing protein